MRQIQIGALLLGTTQLLLACSGEEFAPLERPASDDDGAYTSNESGEAGASSSGSGHQSAGSGQGGTTSKPPTNPSAGSSAGGAPGMGGGSSTAGASSAGAPGHECTTGQVLFTMLPSPDLTPDYLCDAGCGSGWLSITDAAGATVFSIISACGTASCELCEPVPCAAGACLPTPLGSEGRELVWDGTFLKADSCGNNLACQRRTCMPEGVYRAKACVALNAGSNEVGAGCTPKADARLCTEVEFELPGASEVKLILQK
jgi:hypothetical protein